MRLDRILWIDLVGEDFFFDGFVNGRVETVEDVGNEFAIVDTQQGVDLALLHRRGHAPDRRPATHRDLAIAIDQVLQVGPAVAHAAMSRGCTRSPATFHGNSSSMRLTGCSAIRPST